MNYGRRKETDDRYERIFDLIAQGLSLEKACAVEGIHAAGFRRNWGDPRYPDLRPRYKDALNRRKLNQGKIAKPQMGLSEFRKVVLGNETYPHMQQWADWMEGPDDHVMIETRPESGKSTFLRDYCLWRIAHDHTIRIAYSSAAANHAINQVSAIRSVIEANDELRRRYGDLKPGPDKRGHPWGRDQFMVAAREFTAGEAEADFTTRAFGLGGQIEGARADIFIVDDADGKRYGDSDRDRIFETLLTVIESRLAVGGKLIVLTNRWAVNDVASRIRAQEEAEGGLWKIYSSPAILRERKCVEDCPTLPCQLHPPDPKDWGEVLWPEKFGAMTKKVGDRWTKERAWKVVETTRRRLKAAGLGRLFQLVYQNDPDSSEEREFTDECIQRAIDRGADYSYGRVPPHSVVVCSQDPAGETGGAASLTLALTDKGPLVVDLVWDRNVGHEGLLNWVRDFAKYQPRYWGIEAQGGFSLYAKDAELIALTRPAFLHSMHTNQNKHAEGVGISSLIPIIWSELIIPSKTPEDLARMQPLINQLRLYRRPKWNPISGKWDKPKGAFDAVMALWLAFRVVREKNVQRVPTGVDRNYWKSDYGNSFKGGGFAVKR